MSRLDNIERRVLVFGRLPAKDDATYLIRVARAAMAMERCYREHHGAPGDTCYCAIHWLTEVLKEEP